MKKNLIIGVDVDDTLVQTAGIVLDRVNKLFNKEYKVEDLDWDFNILEKEERDWVFNVFFTSNHEVENFEYPSFTKALIDGIMDEGHDLYFVTAAMSEVMSGRAMSLRRAFPRVHPKKFILSHAKHLIEMDILFDDRIDNIIQSKAKVPVIVSRPWNKNLTGYPRVDFGDVETMLKIVDAVSKGADRHDVMALLNQDPIPKSKEKRLFVIVGPSGCGKTYLTKELEKTGLFEKVRTATSRQMREGESELDYDFISNEEFEKRIQEGKILEHVHFDGCYYGTDKQLILETMERKTPVIILDIMGAKRMEKLFPGTVTIYIDRDLHDCARSVLERVIPEERKMDRIIGLKNEAKSKDFCHLSFKNNGVNAESFISYMVERIND